MFCDIFSKEDAKKLLSGKRIYFFGSSNMRSIYKDLIWLLNHGNLATHEALRTKNEHHYLGDRRISHGLSHNGTDYKETRVYEKGPYLYFHFLTRLYLKDFISIVKNVNKVQHPDVIFINSTLWDLSRWGKISESIKNFKINLMKTLMLLKENFPNARIIWKTALPVSVKANGAIFTDEVKSIVPVIPWHLLAANNYAASVCQFFNVDVLDLHHYLRTRGVHFRVKDGIHWNVEAVRYMTNVLLTHLALSWDSKLPGIVLPDKIFINETSERKLSNIEIDERLKNKDIHKLGKSAEVIHKVSDISKPINKAKNKIKRRITKPNTDYSNFINDLKNCKSGISQNENWYKNYSVFRTVQNVPNAQSTSYNIPQNYNQNIPQNFDNIPQNSMYNTPQNMLPNRSYYSTNYYRRPQAVLSNLAKYKIFQDNYQVICNVVNNLATIQNQNQNQSANVIQNNNNYYDDPQMQMARNNEMFKF